MWSLAGVAVAAVSMCATLLAFGTGSPKHGSPGGSQRIPAASTTQPGPAELLSKALAAWDGFPAALAPRPLVLVEIGAPILAPPDGFQTVDMKSAFEQGTIQRPARLPYSPTARGGYRVITAIQALRELSTPQVGPPYGSVPPLQVTDMTLGSATFVTDRGPRQLPAWEFSFKGVGGSAAVLAVSPSEIFTPPQPYGQESYFPAAGGASIGRNGRTMTVGFVGAAAGTGPCTADYTLQILTSDHAVAVAVIEHDHPMPVGSNAGCADVGYSRQATIELTTPVVGRVVVDAATLFPIPVTGPGT